MLKINSFFSTKALALLIIIINSVVPLIIWPYGSDYFYYPKILIIYFVVLLALFICYMGYKNRSIDIKLRSEFIAVLLFLFLVILSTIFSKFQEQSFWGRPFRWEGALTYLSYFIILYLSYLCSYKIEYIKIIVNCILVSSSIISIYALFQYFGLDPIPRDSIRASWAFTSFATLGNPNFLGSYISIVFPISLFLYLWSSKRLSSTFLFISSVLTYSALICARSRSAWVGVAFSMVVIVILFYKVIIKEYKRLVLILTVLIIVTIALNNFHGGSISAKFDSLVSDYKTVTSKSDEKSTAGSQRIFIWSRTMDYVFERPLLGSGPDTFEKVFKMSPEEAKLHFESESVYVDKAHNDYLQIIITMGFPALIIYIIFLAMVTFKSFSNIQKKQYDRYTICLLSAAIAYIAQAFFNISVVSVAPLFWSVLGLLMGSNNINRNRPLYI